MPARFKAFSLHLAISAVIALLTLLLVFWIWYPAPLHVAVGVTHIFLLLLLVDVLLGPLLTLVVYDVGKKTLVFDLAVIALMQLSALGYGLSTLAEGRPAWLVFNADRFDLVRALDIDARQLSDARLEYRVAPWLGPQWIGAVKPKDIALRNIVIFESVMGGNDIAQRPSLYRPLSSMSDALRRHARPLEELRSYNDGGRVQAALAQWPNASAWLPLMANAKSMTVLVDKKAAEVVAVVDLAPWD